MKTFLVIAHDATDENVLARRDESRAAHFARLPAMVESGQIIAGGGMLDDAWEKPIGSTFFAEFESQEALQEWLDSDPFTLNGVWTRFEIIPVGLAIRDGKIVRGPAAQTATQAK